MLCRFAHCLLGSAGRIIGPKAALLKAIEEKHGVQITLPPKHEQAPVVSVIVRCTGLSVWGGGEEDVALKAAAADIRSLTGEEHRVTFRIPSDCAGRIIGTKGATKCGLQERHSVKIKLGSAEGFEIPVEVESDRSAEAVMAAQEEIRALVQAAQKPRTTTATFWIPADRAGKVIGHQGSQIKSLQERFSVKIGLHTKESAKETKVEVIGGSAESLQSAGEAIKSLVATKVVGIASPPPPPSKEAEQAAVQKKTNSAEDSDRMPHKKQWSRTTAGTSSSPRDWTGKNGNKDHGDDGPLRPGPTNKCQGRSDGNEDRRWRDKWQSSGTTQSKPYNSWDGHWQQPPQEPGARGQKRTWSSTSGPTTTSKSAPWRR